MTAFFIPGFMPGLDSQISSWNIASSWIFSATAVLSTAENILHQTVFVYDSCNPLLVSRGLVDPKSLETALIFLHNVSLIFLCIGDKLIITFKNPHLLTLNHLLFVKYFLVSLIFQLDLTQTNHHGYHLPLL